MRALGSIKLSPGAGFGRHPHCHYKYKYQASYAILNSSFDPGEYVGKVRYSWPT